ncbi:MAG TPA: hypothetical protein VJ890_26690 [Vineibacter sp.]|nr:hypothetical protein [Vineibacter sp.]
MPLAGAIRGISVNADPREAKGGGRRNANFNAPIAAAAMIAAVVTPAGAAAQSIAEVMEQWGLVGTWAVNCHLPPSRTNGMHSTYLPQLAGNVDVRRDFGDPQYNDVSQVIAARLQPDGRLEVTVDPRQIFTYTLAKGADGRIRSMIGRLGNGEYTVRDGKFVATGAPTPWQSRCR